MRTSGFTRPEDGPLLDKQKLDPSILSKFGSAAQCASWMQKWEKYTALGAVGPDLFFLLQDYAFPHVPCDEIMLALSAVYMIDDSQRDDWAPLLAILDGVNSTWGKIVRFLIKVNKIWNDFVQVWNDTLGKVVNAVGQVVDDMTGGMLTALGDAITQLRNEILAIIAEEFLTLGDFFSWFNLKMRNGYDEQAYLWSDMTHYRHTSRMAANLVNEARKVLAAGNPDPETNDQYQQFMAYALGWMCHIGTDVVAHSFVNEQCGGPFRTHWQRHHLVENHVDAWNYQQSLKPANTDGFCGATATYPALNESALYFAVQLTPNKPNGDPRPTSLPAQDPGRKAALDTDGEMPDWLAEGLVRTLIATYGADPPAEHPQLLMGSKFQREVESDASKVASIVQDLTGQPMEVAVQELLDLIAPSSKIDVPQGFPLPWEVKTAYRLTLTYMKFSYMDSLNLDKPRSPTIFVPPSSDFQFPGPPDFNGPGSSDDPIAKVANWLKALIDWIARVLEQAAQAAYDIVKMIASDVTFIARELIYQTVTLPAWTAVQNVREILSHLGFTIPQDEKLYLDNGELAKPSEIDTELIKLGHSADAAFLSALAACTDPLGNLDHDPSLVTQGVRNPRDAQYPWLPVRRPKQPNGSPVEYERPWAYPNLNNDKSPNRIEPNQTTSGPYPQNQMPDLLLRKNGPASNKERLSYQDAATPFETDKLNDSLIGHSATDREGAVNPLGDPIIFSSYLIGQVQGNQHWQTDQGQDKFEGADFNLDSDRGYGYLCWDWNRRNDGAVSTETTTIDNRVLQFANPCIWPEGSPNWNAVNDPPMQIHYKKQADPGCVQMMMQVAPKPPKAGKARGNSRRK